MLRSQCEEPPPLGESPPPTPGGANTKLPPITGSTTGTFVPGPAHYPDRWPHPSYAQPVPPTHELLRKRSYNNGNWNLLEAETWEMRDPRQRTLVPPLRDQQGVMQLDSSSVWERRVRLQMALRVESKMEAWLESIGRGAEEGRTPSQARAEFLCPETGADSDTPWDTWDKPYWWSSPTQVDAEPSELGSGYDERSWSEVGDEATPLCAD